MISKVEISGVDTSKIPKLKPKELADLMLLIKKGDEEARQKFIYHNYRLVLSITHRFSAKNSNIDDIFQVGIIGLIKAINNFDVGLNLKFSTYAVPMIIGEIRRYLRDNSCLRISRSIRDIAYQTLLAKERLTKINQKEPSVDEIAKELNLPLKIVFFAMDSTLEPISLFEDTYNNKGDKVEIINEVCDPKQDCNLLLENLELKTALSKLDIREKEIINKRYFEGKTQIEVSEEVGISQAQVSRLEKNALKTLSIQL